MEKNNKWLMIIVSLVGGFLLGIGSYYVLNNLNSDSSLNNKIDNNDSKGEKEDNLSSKMTEEEALKIATEIYKKAYSQITDGQQVIDYGDYSGVDYKVNVQIANTYFTETFVNQMIQYTKEYDNVGVENLFLNSIFGAKINLYEI